MQNDKKSTQIHFYSKRQHVHTTTKLNDNINMNCTIAGSMSASNNYDMSMYILCTFFIYSDKIYFFIYSATMYFFIFN